MSKHYPSPNDLDPGTKIGCKALNLGATVRAGSLAVGPVVAPEGTPTSWPAYPDGSFTPSTPDQINAMLAEQRAARVGVEAIAA